MSDLAGKVHRDRNGGQHYVEFSWRSADYRLTGRFGEVGGATYAEARSGCGRAAWADEDGNFLRSGEEPRRTWSETVDGGES